MIRYCSLLILSGMRNVGMALTMTCVCFFFYACIHNFDQKEYSVVQVYNFSERKFYLVGIFERPLFDVLNSFSNNREKLCIAKRFYPEAGFELSKCYFSCHSNADKFPGN